MIANIRALSVPSLPYKVIGWLSFIMGMALLFIPNLFRDKIDISLLAALSILGFIGIKTLISKKLALPKINTLSLPLRVVTYLLIFLPIVFFIYDLFIALFELPTTTHSSAEGSNSKALFWLLSLGYNMAIVLIAIEIPLRMGINSTRWTVLILAFLGGFGVLIAGLLNQYTPADVFVILLFLSLCGVIIWGLLHRDSKPHFVKQRGDFDENIITNEELKYRRLKKSATRE